MLHVAVAAAKGAFVLGSGTAVAVATGNVHQGITVGQLLAGGGGVILGLSILRAATEVGRLRQMVANHEGRIARIEGQVDRER